MHLLLDSNGHIIFYSVPVLAVQWNALGKSVTLVWWACGIPAVVCSEPRACCVWCSKPLTASFPLGVTAILWVQLTDTATYRPGSVSASQGSLASVARGVKPTILDLVLKAANVRGSGEHVFFHLNLASVCSLPPLPLDLLAFGCLCYIYTLRL